MRKHTKINGKHVQIIGKHSYVLWKQSSVFGKLSCNAWKWYTDYSKPSVITEEPVMPKLSRTFAQRISRAELAITGLESDPAITTALTPFGYDVAKRAEGVQLLARANAILVTVQEARAAQLAATQAVKDAEKIARTAYADLATVARTIFKGDTASLAALGLSGPAPKPLAEFLLTADKLFRGAESAPQPIKDKLAGVGYNAAKLASEHAKITALHAANQTQEQAKGTAQNVTPEQEQTLTDLDSYSGQLRKFARIALRATPQLLEKLGIKA